MPAPPSPRPNATDAVAPDLTDAIARAELLRRLALGAAHQLNNAFTAVIGEAVYLLEERKADPLVAESCTLIRDEVERAARLVRAIATRVQRASDSLEETDLVALVRGLETLLRETVTRSIEIACSFPHDEALVTGPVVDLELLVLLAAHRLVESAPGGVLHVAVAPVAGGAEVRFELRTPAGHRIERAPTPWDDAVDRAIAAIAQRQRVTLAYEDDTAAQRVRLRMQALPAPR